MRCIIAVKDTNGTFRFHQIRPGESWNSPGECLDTGGPVLDGRGVLAHARAPPMKAEVSFSR